jgi:hypothetical protein
MSLFIAFKKRLNNVLNEFKADIRFYLGRSNKRIMHLPPCFKWYF